MTGSDASVEIFKHSQSYALLNSFLAGVANIDFDEIEVTYASTADTFVLKKAGSSVGTAIVTYTTADRDIVTNLDYTAA